MAEQLLTLTQVADQLQVSEWTVRDWRKRGRGPKAIKVGAALRYRQSDLDAWLDLNTDVLV